jgi:hypothetical protein
MNQLEFLAAIASVITAVIGVPSIILLYLSVRHAEHSLRASVYEQAFEMLEKTRQGRHLLYEKVPPEANADFFDQLSSDDLIQLDEVARSFDKVGLLVEHKILPSEFIFDFYSFPLVLIWHRLEPYIRRERERRGQPLHMIMFERLAIKTKAYRDKKNLGGETFTLRSLEEYMETTVSQHQNH